MLLDGESIMEVIASIPMLNIFSISLLKESWHGKIQYSVMYCML